MKTELPIKSSENEQDIKNFQARQFSERVCRNGENSRQRKRSVPMNGGGFVAHLLLQF